MYRPAVKNELHAAGLCLIQRPLTIHKEAAFFKKKKKKEDAFIFII